MSVGAAASGFALGLALITPIGAQNAYVLQTAVRAPRRALLAVTATVIAIDVALIAAGAAGAGAVLDGRDWLRIALYLGGVALLLPLAVGSLRRAITGASGLADALPSEREVADAAAAPAKVASVTAEPRTADTQAQSPVAGIWAWLAPALAVSLLNPHVYLDTVAILGSAIASQPRPDRSAFVGGAMTASAAWFTLLAVVGTVLLRRYALAARIVDGVAGLVMLVIIAAFLREAWVLA